MPESPSMNIFYIHSHDTGRWVQPYGHPVDTPHIQRFAEQGVLFRHAFSTAPACSASRSSLLTGQYPHTNGMFGLASLKWGWRLNDYSRHLARFLREHGYKTALCGVSHVSNPTTAGPEKLGYDRVLEGPFSDRPHEHLGGVSGAPTAESAARYLLEDHDKPFFLSVGFHETHRRNNAGGADYCYDLDTDPDAVDGRYDAPPPHMPDTPMMRKEMANYRVGAKKLDEKVGTVLRALARSPQADNTLVILTTDHGPAWPNHKCNVTDGGTGVMLMLRGPEATGFTGGRVIDPMVSQLDLYPTLCEMLGLQPPDGLQGESLLPLVRGEVEQLHETMYAEQTHHGKPDPMRSVRTQRYRYIRRMDIPHIRICDPGPGNNRLRELGYPAFPKENELLYDLYFDPCEVHNFAADDEYQEILAAMRQRLDRWMEQTDDPFRHGDIVLNSKHPALREAEESTP